MSESSSRSRTGHSDVELRAMEPSGLPLIQCPTCKKEQVLELVSKSSSNYMERFFKCPKKFIVAPLCSYYVWRDVYASYLQKKGFITTEEMRHYLLKQQLLRQELDAERLKQEVESMRKDLVGTEQLKEEIQLLKMEFANHKQAMEGNMQMVATWGKNVGVFLAVSTILVVMRVLGF